MTDIKLILSDIDGTILNDNNIVDSGLKESIERLKQKEIPFVLASARSPKGMLPIAQKLDVLDNPIACYNGALVIKDLKNENYSTVFSHGLDNNEVEQIVKIIHDKYPKVSINLYTGADWYVEDTDKWVTIESEITEIDPIVTDVDKLVEKHQIPIHKILLVSDSAEIDKVMNYLRDAVFPNSSFYLSKPNYLEITNSNVSKEKALRELAKAYELDLKDTMTIGDNFNDVPMLKLAGLGVAMQNAPVEVKKCANVVTDSNNQNGVSKAVEKYVL